jgi:hypothetical protein
VYKRLTAIEGRVMRLLSPELDRAMTEWYGYAPAGPEQKVNQKLGQVAVSVGALTGTPPEALLPQRMPREMSDYSFGRTPRYSEP